MAAVQLRLPARVRRPADRKTGLPDEADEAVTGGTAATIAQAIGQTPVLPDGAR
jgi:hypothetical protein